MNKTVYALGKSKDETLSMFAFLEKQGYHWITPDYKWNDPSVFNDINLNHNVLISVNNVRHIVEPVPVMSLSPVDLESTMAKALNLESLKETLQSTNTEKETIKSEQKEKPKANFVKITGNQIIASWESKKVKDDYGNPRRYCKVRLPSSNFSADPIRVDGKLISDATIIVPEFIITEDKYNKLQDGREHKIIGIRPNMQYTVFYDTGKRDEKNYKVEAEVKVSGSDLIKAFKYKEKSLDHRLDSATKKKGQAHEPTKEKEQRHQDQER